MEDLIEQVLSTMKAQGLTVAKSIEVSVGSSSGYSPESIRQAYEMLSAETELNGTALVLRDVEGQEVILQRMVLEE